MKEQILIVEDQFVEADYLRLLLEQAGYTITGIARSVPQAQQLIADKKPDFVLLDILLKGKQTGIDLAKQLATDNIPFVYLSANSDESILNAAKETQPYGFLVKPFREKDLLVALEIAKYRHAHSVDARYRREADLRKLLKTVITDSGTYTQKLLKIATALPTCIPFDFLAAGFDEVGEPLHKGTGFLRIGFEEYQIIGIPELAVITGKSIEELKQLSLKKLFADTFQLQSHMEMPMRISNKPFPFCLYSRRPEAYGNEQVDLFERIQFSMTQTIEHLLKGEIDETAIIHLHKTSAAEHANTGEGFEGIVGKSHLLLNVFDHISQVAPSDTSVLILGESGTGKEKIANCIHDLSYRKGKPFVKVNCAALPATLIESELFGHEKGAFTGALEKRIGKFERADKGTLFLDEVGEMPIELQVKLLRVLQEKEIERVGGRDTIKVDVRIIAATNKNLEKEVAEGRFRLDLYYRLNVFPIMLPALRERREDIPALAYYFMNHYNHKAGKKINSIADNVLKQMMAYNWPGNIRELEHLIERSVLLAKGTVIEEILLPTVEKNDKTAFSEDAVMKTIAENEKRPYHFGIDKMQWKNMGAGRSSRDPEYQPFYITVKNEKTWNKKRVY